MAYDYDLFVIGAGSGGVRAARLAAMTGAKVAAAEEYRAGGTCVMRGCMPKKYMVYASEFGRTLEHMEGYGWTVENASYDHNLFMDRMHREVDRLSGIYARNLRNAGAELIDDRAELIDPHTLKLMKSGKTVTAGKILIATGGRASLPEGCRGRGARNHVQRDVPSRRIAQAHRDHWRGLYRSRVRRHHEQPRGESVPCDPPGPRLARL